MRSAVQRLGSEPEDHEPLVAGRSALSITVQVEFFGRRGVRNNLAMEFKRNSEVVTSFT